MSRASETFKEYTFDNVRTRSGNASENGFTRIRYEDGGENGVPRADESTEEKLEAARAVAYSEGYAAGKDDGVAAERKRLGDLLDNLGNSVSELAETRDKLYRGFEEQCVLLAFAVAEKVIRRRIEADREIVVQAVRDALDIVKDYRTVKIRLHPEDVELVQEAESLIKDMIEKGKEITVVGDGAIERGGCLIETDFGIVDARVGSRIQAVEEALEALLP